MRDQHRTKILILGHGVLGGAVLDFLSQSGKPYELYVGARDTQKATLRVNLARYTAFNLGHHPEIEIVPVDLMNVDATAALLSALRPDIIFNATTLHSWWVITQLPAEAYQRIDRAKGGVWTPMHLVLIRRLMKAVREAALNSMVVNASYPDVTNAALAAEGLSPTIGIGNIANAVPGIRLAAAYLLNCEPSSIDIRFFAQHYISYRMPSTGTTDGAPYHLSVYRDGKEVGPDQLSHEELFKHVAGRFRRVKGLAGQSVTASSATSVLLALAEKGEHFVHAPGPLGLVGGYAVRISSGGLSLALPPGLTAAAAIDVNRRCQRYDGIDAVEADGTVRFTAETAAVMRDVLGYDCEAMALDECEERAAELAAKFKAFRAQVTGQDSLRAA